MNFHIQSISNIDNRGFPGSDVLVPGPLGYQFSIYSHVINLIPFVMFFLNQWLADGLLVRPVLNSVSNPSRKRSL